MRKQVVLLAFLAAFLPGCGDVATGDCSVAWAIGLTGSCEDARLSHVTVRLETGDGYSVGREEAYCASGQIDFSNVPAGSLRALVTAFDDEGVAAYEAVLASVGVPEGSRGGPYLARLAPRPSDLHVVWYFDGGRLCGSYDVQRVRLRLFTDDTEVLSREVGCEQGDVVLGDLRAAVYSLRVEGLGRDGSTAFSFTQAGLDVRPGHLVEVEAPLASCLGLDSCR